MTTIASCFLFIEQYRPHSRKSTRWVAILCRSKSKRITTHHYDWLLPEPFDPMYLVHLGFRSRRRSRLVELLRVRLLARPLVVEAVDEVLATLDVCQELLLAVARVLLDELLVVHRLLLLGLPGRPAALLVLVTLLVREDSVLVLPTLDSRCLVLPSCDHTLSLHGRNRTIGGHRTARGGKDGDQRDRSEAEKLLGNHGRTPVKYISAYGDTYLYIKVKLTKGKG